MCGRGEDDFGWSSRKVLDQVFGPFGWGQPNQRSEVRPTDPIRFVYRQGDGFAAPFGRWGLVPHGMTLAQASKYATFNARVETLAEKPMFRDAFRQRRCVIPLSAYWEWRTDERGRKQKYRFARKDDKPLLVAGLCNAVETREGLLESCTIVTREPLAEIAGYHDRMPVLLLTKDLAAWLDGEERRALAAAMTSWPSGVLNVTPA